MQARRGGVVEKHSAGIPAPENFLAPLPGGPHSFVGWLPCDGSAGMDPSGGRLSGGQFFYSQARTLSGAAQRIPGQHLELSERGCRPTREGAGHEPSTGPGGDKQGSLHPFG